MKYLDIIRISLFSFITNIVNGKFIYSCKEKKTIALTVNKKIFFLF